MWTRGHRPHGPLPAAALHRLVGPGVCLFGPALQLLFLQQAVKGSVEEFQGAEPGASSQWQLVNGLWSLLLAFGLLLTSLLLRTARSWRFLRSPLRCAGCAAPALAACAAAPPLPLPPTLPLLLQGLPC